MPVASPCTGLCPLTPERGYGPGGWRSVEEIAAWSQRPAGPLAGVLAVVARRREEGDPRTGEPSSA